MPRPITNSGGSLPAKPLEANKKAVILTGAASGATLGAIAGVAFGPMGILAGAVAGAVVGAFAGLATFAINALMDRFNRKPTDEQFAATHSAALDLYLNFLSDGHYSREDGPFRVGGNVTKEDMSSLIRSRILTEDPSNLSTKIREQCDQNSSPAVFLTDLIKNKEFDGLLSLPFQNLDQAKKLNEQVAQLKANPENENLKKEIISELASLFQNQSQTHRNAQIKFIQALKATVGKTKMTAEGLTITPGKIMFSKLEKAAAANPNAMDMANDMVAITGLKVLAQFIIENADAIVSEVDKSAAEKRLNELRERLLNENPQLDPGPIFPRG